MKKWLSILFIVFIFLAAPTAEINAQCSICTKTAQQLGEKPAKALNTGILYMAFAPLAIIGFLGYRWWKSNKDVI